MRFKKRFYFDTAAGVSPNPSSPHAEGRAAKKILEDARTTVARLLEVQSDDVLFTSGATESNALAILGLLKAGDHALYLPSAHASIVENMKLARVRGVEIEELRIRDTKVDCQKLQGLLRPETRLVAMDAVCGETGVVWNTREVASALRERSRGLSEGYALLHVDASQAPWTEKITRAHFGADLLTLDGSKIGSARGIGLLVAHRTIPIAPLYGGGGQEREVRSGSQAPELAAGLAASLREAAQGREAFSAQAANDRQKFIERITAAIPNVYINEASEPGLPAGRQAPNILNLSFPGWDTDYLVALLDEAGFAVSTRSACETDSEEGSRAVYALFGDTERARSTLRVSWGPGISSRAFSGLASAIVHAQKLLLK